MNYIVTMTSYGQRVKDTAPYAICSLLNQSCPPDKVILWLAYKTPIPEILMQLCTIGLEIRFCKDIGPFTKIVPALKEFPDDVLITADDDVFYPSDWFKQLKSSYLKSPRKIHVHRAHRILFEKEDNLKSYNQWLFAIGCAFDSDLIFPTGVGGILYPPNSLDPLCVDSSIFLTLTPNADDIWLWAMAILKGTKYSLVKDGYRKIRSIPAIDDGLWYINNRGGNDEQLNAIFKRFPYVFEQLLKANNKFKARLKHKESENPYISVVMPCYNSEEHIEKAIESILKQDFDNFEFIIINDGSTDRTNELISKYLYDHRIKYIELEKNGGNYPARNIGLKLSKGKYIAVMDADDIAERSRLFVQFEFLELHKDIGCVGTQAYSINNRNEVFTQLDKPTEMTSLKVFLIKDNYLLHPSLMFRKSIIVKHSIEYNECLVYAADYDFVVKLSRVSKVANLPDRLMNYRFHDAQISSTQSQKQKAFADQVRLEQLNQFGVPLKKFEENAYLKIMKGDELTADELTSCQRIFEKLIDKNKSLKIYNHNYLKSFLKLLLIR